MDAANLLQQIEATGKVSGQDEAKAIMEVWGRPRREMNWCERFFDSLGIVFGFGDDLLTILASKIVPKKVEWLWPNRVPLGKLTLFVGDPDNGKSMVGTYVTAATTTGLDWYEAKNVLSPSEVLIFASEDDKDDTIVPRLIAAGANLDKVQFGEIRSDGPNQTSNEREMQLDKDVGAIRKALLENRNIRLVVIDPVSNYVGNVKMIEEQAIRRVLAPLQKLAAETSVAIIGIMHLNKKADLQVINRVGGAMAFVGVARAVWLFCRDKENPDEFQMLCVKKNIGERSNGLRYQIATRNIEIDGEEIPQPFIEWLGETDQSANDVLVSKSVGRASELEKASEWLKSLLSAGPKRASDVEQEAVAAGFSDRTLKRGKAKLGVQSEKKGDGWYWRL